MKTDQKMNNHLHTHRLRLIGPEDTKPSALCDYYRRNRDHLAPWDPRRPDKFYDEHFWVERLEQFTKEQQEGHAVRWCLTFDIGAADVLGVINFTQIFMGPFRSCMLGYSIDSTHQGQGLMKEALTAAIDHLFREKQLHRVQANYVPVNERSARLLKALDFQVEGYARDYLFINGQWRDHILTAKRNPDAIDMHEA